MRERLRFLTVVLVSVGLLALGASCGGGGGEGGDAEASADTKTGLDLALSELPNPTDVPGGMDLAPVPDAVGEICEADCGERLCGDDGCGGSCGDCADGEACQGGECVGCTPACDFKVCGDDGCGGSCGDCNDFYECDFHTGRCVLACLPNCAGRWCGPDGCGGECGDCDPGLVCNRANGQCQQTCLSYCTNRECGTDGCSGSCGGCVFPESCNEQTGRCVDECVRQCDGRECGTDGCDGRCGYCPAGFGCEQGTCTALPLTCAQIRSCVRQCPHDDVPCANACRAQGDPSSAIRYDAVANCEQSNCAALPAPDREPCVGQSCPAELTACNGDLRCGDPGTQACMTVASCMGGCADGACLNTCLCQADEPSYEAARAMADCILQNCPSFDGTCMASVQMSSCVMQWMGCMGSTP